MKKEHQTGRMAKGYMNANIRYIRFFFALVLALSALGISSSAALADKPTKTESTFTVSDVITGLCSFPVSIDATVTINEIDFFNSSGALTGMRWHVAEQDTFTANGKTLVGMPYTTNVEWLPDSSGNLTPSQAFGVVEKVRLPDGSLFITAGWVDYTANPGIWVFSTDRGNPGNIAGFCAALAP